MCKFFFFSIFLMVQPAWLHAQYSGTFPIDSMTNEQGLVIEGIDEFDGLGRSVSSVGDFNNDGIDDITVGRPGNDFGRAYVIFGNTFQPDNPLNPNQITGGNGFAVKGNPATGISVSSAGDFNGDGIDDLLIAAGYTIEANMDNAIAYVLFGTSAPMLQTVDLNQMTPTEGIKFNRPILDVSSNFTVSNAGDFNHDGFDDILVSSTRSALIATNAGSTYVIYGNNTLAMNAIDLDNINGSNGIRISGTEMDDFLGFSLSAAGDFNGDKYDDILINAEAAQDGYKGHAYLIFGSQTPTHPFLLSNINGANGVKFIGEANDNFAGQGLGGQLDFNHDGFQDIVIGAPEARDQFNIKTGRTYVVFGTTNNLPANFLLADIDGSNGVVINGLNPSGNAGRSASVIGDFNGDLIDDLIIGGPAFNTNGWAYIIYGKTNPPPIIEMFPLSANDGFRILSFSGYNRFGYAVSSAGDFNNDGLSDALIGAWTEFVDLTDNVGKAYILYGNDTIFQSSFDTEL